MIFEVKNDDTMLYLNLQAGKRLQWVNCLDLKTGPLLYIDELFGRGEGFFVPA